MNDALGAFLRDRRARLDPAALGFAIGRRRTPGLRREEVAQRAHISPTWYTWLEQGRGGAPSAPVLERIAAALMLTEVEREHLFLLGLGRPPQVRYGGGGKLQAAPGGVTPRLQRVLDALDPAPALIRSAVWDVLAWNRAATVMLADYARLPAEERNILRLLFLDPRARAAQSDWAQVARFAVGAFRADSMRAGASALVEPLVSELCHRSPEFKALWQDQLLQGAPGESAKLLRHPVLGALSVEYSVFGVDGRTDLSLIVYQPATPAEAARLRLVVEASTLPAPPR